MNRIIAGRFEQKQPADSAVEALGRRGFAPHEISTFFLTPPGQHATFPLGGDEDVSPGAAKASGGATKGALIGGAAGFAVGLAASPLAGVAAPVAATGVGAYAGSLLGALTEMKKPAEQHAAATAEEEDPETTKSRPAPRRSGVMVAAHARDEEQRRAAVEVLCASGAEEIESADGEWRDGRWLDFDPLKPPELIDIEA